MLHTRPGWLTGSSESRARGGCPQAGSPCSYRCGGALATTVSPSPQERVRNVVAVLLLYELQPERVLLDVLLVLCVVSRPRASHKLRDPRSPPALAFRASEN